MLHSFSSRSYLHPLEASPAAHVYEVELPGTELPQKSVIWYLLKGFSPPEWGKAWNRPFYWSDGNQSLILLIAPSTDPGMFLSISFDAFPIKDSQGMLVLIDDQPLFHFTFKNGWNSYTFPLHHVAPGYHLLKFTYDHVVNERLPAHMNTVSRRLAVGFSDFQFKTKPLEKIKIDAGTPD